MNRLLTTIILTKDESKHINRCIKSVRPICEEILVIDCKSSDDTIEIAKTLDAKVIQHEWPGNQAEQLNWALSNIDFLSPWILRLDADEYLTPELAQEISENLINIPDDVTGVYLKRRVYFMGKWIRHGGYYPTKILRIWRKGQGHFEAKWMDEHFILDGGRSIELKNDFIDHNLNNLSWWTEKHNNYATREAIETLNKEYNFFQDKSIEASLISGQDSRKRWYKTNVYSHIPLFVRPFFYFLFRYFILLGFLDGKKGLIWHFLQGFWYRFLVDAKVYQIKYISKTTGKPVINVIREDFGVKV